MQQAGVAVMLNTKSRNNGAGRWLHYPEYRQHHKRLENQGEEPILTSGRS